MRRNHAARVVQLALGLALASAAIDALAQQENPWYVGVSAGQSSATIDDDSLTVSGATASSLSKSETDTGLKIYGGYRFNRNFALEAGYTDLGSFSATRTVTAPAAGSIRAETKVSGWNVDAVGILPFGPGFSVFGKLGLFFNQVETTLSPAGAVVLVPGVDRNPSHSDANLKYGIGLGYDFTDRLGVRVEWEQYHDLGSDSTGGKADVDLISAGVIFRF